MKKINIGYINDVPFYLGYGGKEVQMLAYETFVNSTNFINVTRLDPWVQNHLKDVNIVHIFGSTKGVHTLVRNIKSNKKDVVIILSPNFYIHNPFIAKIANLFNKLCPIPNVIKYRLELFLNSDIIIANSESEKRQLMYLYPFIKCQKIKVLYNGIEKDFSILDNKYCFLEKYNLESGYFLCVAFMDERKNTIRLIESFLLTKNYHQKKLVLIGGLRFEKKKNADIAKNLILSNSADIIHIEYIDKNKDLELLKSAYFNSSAHLLPSILETPGISNLEALSFGKPILVGECEPVKEYFKDYAMYCNPKSTNDISEKIIDISKLSLKSKIKDFVWDTTLLKLPEIYQENQCNIMA